jgi:uncharacterized protein (TIGR04255 family)
VDTQTGETIQMQKHYKKAPITEAIIDLKVALPEGFTVDQLKNIYPQVRDNFPTIEPFYKGIGALSYQSEGSESLTMNATQEQIGFWFRSEDNLQTFQATLEGFSSSVPFWIPLSSDMGRKK